MEASILLSNKVKLLSKLENGDKADTVASAETATQWQHATLVIK
jgi:hypothetical protein